MAYPASRSRSRIQTATIFAVAVLVAVIDAVAVLVEVPDAAAVLVAVTDAVAVSVADFLIQRHVYHKRNIFV